MSKLKISKYDWETKAQPGELEFHKKDIFRPSGGLDRETEQLFTSLGFARNDYEGKYIVDAGCGSMLRSKFFTNSFIIGIDPLANEYKKIEWNNLHLAKLIISQPLEERVELIKELIDFVMSINVLDHCYDFRACVENLYYYLKQDGLCFISFDEHERNVGIDGMHPLDLTYETCYKIFTDVGFKIIRFRKGKVYGGGSSSLNFWLVKNV